MLIRSRILLAHQQQEETSMNRGTLALLAAVNSYKLLLISIKISVKRYLFKKEKLLTQKK